jgi:hypothetical protein
MRLLLAIALLSAASPAWALGGTKTESVGSQKLRERSVRLKDGSTAHVVRRLELGRLKGSTTITEKDGKRVQIRKDADGKMLEKSTSWKANGVRFEVISKPGEPAERKSSTSADGITRVSQNNGARAPTRAFVLSSGVKLHSVSDFLATTAKGKGGRAATAKFNEIELTAQPGQTAEQVAKPAVEHSRLNDR